MKVSAEQGVPADFSSGLPHYAFAVLIGIDVLANALIGGEVYQTISCRIGESIAAGGWAARVPWPAWFVAHCQSSVFSTVV